MNGFSYENQGSNTFLVYEVGANDELDTMSLGMLTNNKIPGLAPTLFTQVDNVKFIKYNVSAKISVAQLFAGAVNKKRLLGVFTGIIDAMLSAEDYMLDSDSLLLDLEHIFADVSTCETVLICVPVMNSGHKNPDLGMFFKNIIFNTQFDQTENCDHVAQILNYLNSVKTLSLPDFKELLKDMSKVKEAPKPVQPAAPQPVVTAAAPVQPAVPQSVVTPAAPVQPQVEVPVASKAAVHLTEDMLPDLPELPELPDLSEPEQSADEKPMSMFYLLQHYNKENAAKYKAQQNAKKEAEKQEKQDKKDKKGKKNKKEAEKQAPQPMDTGFAIPGQQPSLNTSFEVPGAPKPVVEAKPAAQTAKAQPVIQKPQPAPVVPVPQSTVSTGKPLNFGETTVLGGAAMGETTVLGVANVEAPKVNPYIVRAKNNERIPLNKPVFRIGKERSYVDYFIGDNTAISRSHANIINRDGEFYIVDTNSTNHTYVNGTMIQSNVETKLENNARIKLANEEFDFRLY